MNRTEQEIIARIRKVSKYDIFGIGDLLNWLSFDAAKEFMVDDVTPERFAEVAARRKQPLDAVRDYLDFAWDKANNCRGLSAMRSMNHLAAWLWLAGFDELADSFEKYELYGKPHLVTASELVGFDWRAVDSGEWVNSEDDGGISADRIAEFAEAGKKKAQEALARKEAA